MNAIDMVRGWAWERRPDGLTLLVALAALAGAGLALARNAAPYTPGITLDSMYYIAAARALQAGEGITDAAGTHYTDWPPLYPIALAATGLRWADALDVVGPLNAAAFALTIFAVGRYLRRRLESRFLVVWACLMLACSAGFVWWTAWAMSDILFILLTTLALINADDYLHKRRTPALALAAVFGALAFQTHYIGAAVPAAISLALLLQRGASPAGRVGRAAVASLTAALPMAAWLIRNQLVAGDVRVRVEPIGVFTAKPFMDALSAMRDWAYIDLGGLGARWQFIEALPLNVAAPALLAAALAFMTAALVVAVRGYWRGAAIGCPSRPASGWRPCWLFGGFALMCLGVTFGGMIAGYSPVVVPRHIESLYIPLLVCAAVALDGLVGWARRRPSSPSRGGMARTTLVSALRVGLPIAALAWLAQMTALNAADLARANDGHIYLQYAEPRWIESDTLRYIRENPDGLDLSGEVWSNEAPFLNLHLGKRVGGGDDSDTYFRLILPRKTETISGGEKLADLAAGIPDDAYVIWITSVNRDWRYGYGIATLRATPGFQPIAELADGAVFRMNRAYVPPSNPYRDAYERIAAGDYGEPASRGDFTIYASEDALVYLKEPCVPADVELGVKFFLHIFPDDAADLTRLGKPHGFNNADFVFGDYGLDLGGKCVAIAPLPAYGIKYIRTGVVGAISERVYWSVELNPNRDRYKAVYERIAEGEYGEAAARSDFAVYRAGDALVYLKEPCVAADAEAKFMLHIYPADGADLPAERAEFGFANADFRFVERGALFEGKCVAIAPLPGYAIERIRTGQFVSGEGELWRAEFAGE